MDFKSLISKLDSMEAPPETPRAPTLPQTIKLNEDAQLRVLAGTSSILEETKKMKKDEEKIKQASKTAKKGKVEEGGLDMNLVKAAQGGMDKNPKDSESDKNVKKKYGYRMDGEPAERDDDETKQDRRGRKRQNKGESIAMEREVDGDEFGDEGPEDLLYAVEREIKNPGKSIDNLIDVQNATFGSDDSPEFEKARRIIEKYIEFVDNADVDHSSDDPDDEEPMIRAMTHGDIARHIREYDLTDYLVAASDMLEKIIATGKSEGFNLRAFESKFAKMVEAKKQEYKKSIKGKKAEEKMDEAKKSSKKKPDANKDGIPDYAQDGKGVKDLGKGKKPADKDGEEKETTGLSAKQKKLPPGLQKAIAAKKGKKTVKESIELKMSFRDMLKLVQESGGQQQIDPLDKTLFAWATRVAQQKFNEEMKAEVYAGLVYERMGGRFDMYDVLSEDRLDENWKKKLAAAAMAGVMGLGAMGGASAADMPGKDPGADRPVAAQSEYGSMIEIEGKVRDLAKVDKKAAKSYEATKSYYNKLLGKAKSSADTKEIDKEYTKSLQSIIDHSTMMKSM